MRWSPCESIGAARAGHRWPSITIPSAVGSTLPPSAFSAIGHGGDPVGLLAAQLGRVADRRRPLGKAGGERHQRQLVDRQRHVGAADLGSRAGRGMADADVGDRLAALVLAPPLDRDRLGPHPPQDLEQARPGRVGADVVEQQVAAEDDRRGEDEEGGGGEVTGDDDAARLEALGRGRSRRRRPSRLYRGAGGGVACARSGRGSAAARLTTGLALGDEPGEEQAGLHLGAGDR